MKIYKIASCFLASALVFSPISVFAADDGFSNETSTETATEITTENEQTNISNNNVTAGTNNTTMTLSEFTSMIDTKSDSFTKVNNDDVFQMMKNSLDAGESVRLMDAWEISEGLSIPDNMMYDLSECGMDGSIDASEINFDYANLMTKLDENYATASTDLSAFTISSTELFNNTYGDLAEQLKVGEAVLPDGFDFNTMTTQNSASMQTAYESALNDSEYLTVKNTVSVNNVFEQAKNGPTKYSLMSADDLSKLLKTYSSDLEEDYESAKNNKSTEIRIEAGSNKSAVESEGASNKSNVDADMENTKQKYEDRDEKVYKYQEDEYYSPGNVGEVLSDEFESWGDDGESDTNSSGSSSNPTINQIGQLIRENEDISGKRDQIIRQPAYKN